MTVQPFALPRSQIVDSRGVPVRGARVSVYDADTGIRKRAFKDSAFKEDHTWPIIADSAGMLPMVYLLAGYYKIVVEDQHQRQVYSEPRVVVSAANSNSTQSGLNLRVVQQFQSVYLTADDANTLQDVTATDAPVTMLLPKAETIGNGALIAVRKAGGNSAVVVRPSDGTKIDGRDEIKLNDQYQYILLVSDGGSWLGLTINQAAEVGFVPANGMTSTNVQSALIELAVRLTGATDPVLQELAQVNARLDAVSGTVNQMQSY